MKMHCYGTNTFTVKPWVAAGLDPTTLANSFLVEVRLLLLLLLLVVVVVVVLLLLPPLLLLLLLLLLRGLMRESLTLSYCSTATTWTSSGTQVVCHDQGAPSRNSTRKHC